MAAGKGGCVAISFAKGFASVNKLVKLPAGCGIDGLLWGGMQQTHVHDTTSEESLSDLGHWGGLVVSWFLLALVAQPGRFSPMI